MKGQGNGSGEVGDSLLSFNLIQVEMLLSLEEGEDDLEEGGVEDIALELLQVVVEGMDVKQLKNWPR